MLELHHGHGVWRVRAGAAWSIPDAWSMQWSTPATKSELCPEATDRVRENKMLSSH